MTPALKWIQDKASKMYKPGEPIVIPLEVYQQAATEYHVIDHFTKENKKQLPDIMKVFSCEGTDLFYRNIPIKAQSKNRIVKFKPNPRGTRIK